MTKPNHSNFVVLYKYEGECIIETKNDTFLTKLIEGRLHISKLTDNKYPITANFDVYHYLNKALRESY